MKRLIRLGEKVYDRDLMDRVRINDAQLRYLFEAETGRPHRARLSHRNLGELLMRGMISTGGVLMPRGHEALQKCEASVDCTRCRCYKTEGGIERCAIYGTIAAAGQWCHDWED